MIDTKRNVLFTDQIGVRRRVLRWAQTKSGGTEDHVRVRRLAVNEITRTVERKEGLETGRPRKEETQEEGGSENVSQA